MQQENLELEGGQRAQAQRLNREPKVQKESKIFQNNRKYSKIILKCSQLVQKIIQASQLPSFGLFISDSTQMCMGRHSGLFLSILSHVIFQLNFALLFVFKKMFVTTYFSGILVHVRQND
jgi:hypothetical protein